MKTKQEPEEKSAVVGLAATLKNARNNFRILAVMLVLFAIYGLLVSDAQWYGWAALFTFLGALELSRLCARGSDALAEIHVRLMALNIRQNLTDERIQSEQ